MPFTDLGRTRGLHFRPLSKFAFYIFVANFLILMILGAKHVESPFIELGQISIDLQFYIYYISSLVYQNKYAKSDHIFRHISPTK